MSPHTRETRASAAEIKFVVDRDLGARIREWARRHLEPDPHGTGPFGDQYQTSSLYFDTRVYDVFHRRRSYGRAKYRIRQYGGADVIFLERKLRKPGILIKRRTVSTLDVLDRLALVEPNPGWPGEWFHRRLLLRRLGPVCQVSYHRTARAIANSSGASRLTLDEGATAAPVQAARFGLESGVPILDGQMILELKYRVQFPSVFKRLVEEFTLRTQTASKYRLGMAALGHEPASAEPAVSTSADAFHA